MRHFVVFSPLFTQREKYGGPNEQREQRYQKWKAELLLLQLIIIIIIVISFKYSKFPKGGI